MRRSLSILLIFLFLSTIAYVFVMNKQKKREDFTDVAFDMDPERKKTIVEAFNTVVGRDPNVYELKLYSSFMKDHFDVKPIIDKLKSSKEFTKRANIKTIEMFEQDMASIDQNAVRQKLEATDFDTKIKLYHEIVKLFERVLERLPTVDELNYFTYKKLLEPSVFTEEHIQKILESSPEYQRLRLNQTNTIDTGLVNNVTISQLDAIVLKIYSEVFEKPPEEEIKAFLRNKLYGYALNEEKFRAFLVLLHNFDNNVSIGGQQQIPVPIQPTATTQPTVTTQPIVQPIPPIPQSVAEKVEPVIDKMLDSLRDGNKMPDISNPHRDVNTPLDVVLSENNTQDYKLNKGNGDQNVMATNEKKEIDQICFNNPVKSCMALSGYKDPFRDDLYDNMKAFQNSDMKSFKTPEPNALAEMQNIRNLSELRYACGNNSYFANLEKQMATDASAFDSFLKPSVKNTRYGAYLEDAGNTKVGSIMPPFLFKELKN